jgi:hypothetical protein
VLRPRLLFGLTGLATIAALTLSACDSGDDGDANNLSKGEFASKGNSLCTKAESERGQLLQRLPPTPSGAADAQKLQRVVTIDRELVRRVDDLVPPQGEEDRVDRVLDAWRRRANVEHQYADTVAAMQESQTLAIFTSSLAQVEVTANLSATQLGMTQCTRGPTIAG